MNIKKNTRLKIIGSEQTERYCFNSVTFRWLHERSRSSNINVKCLIRIKSTLKVQIHETLYIYWDELEKLVLKARSSSSTCYDFLPSVRRALEIKSFLWKPDASLNSHGTSVQSNENIETARSVTAGNASVFIQRILTDYTCDVFPLRWVNKWNVWNLHSVMSSGVTLRVCVVCGVCVRSRRVAVRWSEGVGGAFGLFVRTQEGGDFAVDEAYEGARQHLRGVSGGVLVVVVWVSQHVEKSFNEFFILIGNKKEKKIILWVYDIYETNKCLWHLWNFHLCKTKIVLHLKKIPLMAFSDSLKNGCTFSASWKCVKTDLEYFLMVFRSIKSSVSYDIFNQLFVIL